MKRQTISAISIIPLLLGSILLLAGGCGLISTKYAPATGLTFLAVFVLIEIVAGKFLSKS
jgi:hypothetical protein